MGGNPRRQGKRRVSRRDWEGIENNRPAGRKSNEKRKANGVFSGPQSTQDWVGGFGVGTRKIKSELLLFEGTKKVGKK